MTLPAFDPRQVPVVARDDGLPRVPVERLGEQDLRGWFSGVLSNPAGEQLAWDWIRDEWAWLEKTVGGDMEFATFITVISRVFKTKERYDEYNAFFTDKESNMLLNREIKMDRKVIANRVDLIASEQADVNAAVAAALQK